MEEFARPDEFLFKWKDFQHYMSSSVLKLGQDSELSDVTLVCDDNYQVQAHKIILAATSQIFSDLLKQCNQPNTLNSLVDFTYYGKVRLEQEDVNSFIETAEELLIRGIAGPQVKDDSQQTNPEAHIVSDSEHIQTEIVDFLVKTACLIL